MEEEKVEQVQEQPQVNAKNFDFKSFDFKKYLPIAGIALAVVVVLIILVSVLGGGPKKAVKKYVSGLSTGNAKKIFSSVDPIGSAVWGYQYDEDDFDEDDYEDFIDEYEEYADEYADELEEYEDEMKDMIEEMEDEYDDFRNDYKSYKVKVDEFKKVEKIGKNLYVVKAKISTQAKPKDKEEDEIDESEVMTFVVYKNKIISGASVY